MTLEFLQGNFEKKEAITLLTKLIDVKIKHHENSIAVLANEEDIKSREKKIKNLQKSLYEFREFIDNKENINFDCNIIMS